MVAAALGQHGEVRQLVAECRGVTGAQIAIVQPAGGTVSQQVQHSCQQEPGTLGVTARGRAGAAMSQGGRG